jgi:hypothetical protein
VGAARRLPARGTPGQGQAIRLPARQRRALKEIEKALRGEHPGLGPLFDIFTRLTRHEAMPVTERVSGRRPRWQWRRMRGAAVTIAGLAVFSGVLLTLGLTLPDQPACPGAVTTAAAARAGPVPPVGPADCATQRGQPGKTGAPQPATVSVGP